MHVGETPGRISLGTGHAPAPQTVAFLPGFPKLLPFSQSREGAHLPISQERPLRKSRKCKKSSPSRVLQGPGMGPQPNTGVGAGGLDKDAQSLALTWLEFSCEFFHVSFLAGHRTHLRSTQPKAEAEGTKTTLRSAPLRAGCAEARCAGAPGPRTGVAAGGRSS